MASVIGQKWNLDDSDDSEYEEDSNYDPNSVGIKKTKFSTLNSKNPYNSIEEQEEKAIPNYFLDFFKYIKSFCRYRRKISKTPGDKFYYKSPLLESGEDIFCLSEKRKYLYINIRFILRRCRYLLWLYYWS